MLVLKVRDDFKYSDEWFKEFKGKYELKYKSILVSFIYKNLAIEISNESWLIHLYISSKSVCFASNPMYIQLTDLSDVNRLLEKRNKDFEEIQDVIEDLIDDKLLEVV